MLDVAGVISVFHNLRGSNFDILQWDKLYSLSLIRKNKPKLPAVINLYFKACSFHGLTCIFNYLIHLVLLILLFKLGFSHVMYTDSFILNRWLVLVASLEHLSKQSLDNIRCCYMWISNPYQSVYLFCLPNAGKTDQHDQHYS